METSSGVQGKTPSGMFGDEDSRNLNTHISETIRARQLKFHTHVDRVKCSFQI